METGTISTISANMLPTYFPPSPYLYPGITPAALHRGIRVYGRISPIRRFFCLFVTFDLLLTSLLWLQILVFSKDFSWNIVYHQQILHYNIKTSLFDIQFSAITRFVTLLLFYALLEISHWFVVATTTALTIVLLGVKVYMFDWGDSTTQFLQVILILSTFVIVWAEVWLMDIKVIPQERLAYDFMNALSSDERAPLINQFLQSQQNQDAISASVNFYSPYENSSSSSDNDSIKGLPSTSKAAVPQLYAGKSTQILEEAWRLVTEDDWMFEKKTDDGDIISSKRLEKGKKIYKLNTTLDFAEEVVKLAVYDNIHKPPLWNSYVKEFRIIQEIDPNTDITYVLSKKVGVVASREYISLRYYSEKYDYRIVSHSSVSWPRLASSKKIVRGENGPSLMAFRSKEENKTEFLWLFNSSPNGWVPQSILEATAVSVLSETMKNLREHLSQNNQQ